MRPFQSKSNSKCKWFIQLIDRNCQIGFKNKYIFVLYLKKNYKKHKDSEIFKIKGQENTIALKYQPEQSWITTRKKNNVKRKRHLGDKESYYIKITVLIHEEDLSVLNL